MNPILEAVRNFLFQRRRAYVTTFINPPGELVLADLARFCRADKSTFHPDPHMAARFDGRREVFLRIAQHLNLSEEQLWAIYRKSSPTLEK